LALDERIRFVPGWSRVYSMLYCPAVVRLNVVATSPGHFTRIAFNLVTLLAIQVACFAVFPVATRDRWRVGLDEVVSRLAPHRPQRAQFTH
jgi:hypothetical protein